MTRRELEDKMAVLLGGRAAEQLIFGELSTGAADDLARVTEIARNIVMRYGMDEGLGPIAYESEPATHLPVPGLAAPQRAYAEATAREIDLATRKLVDAAFAHSLELLTQRRAALEHGAQALLEKETLTDVDLKALLQTPEMIALPAGQAPNQS
jgi:cell division protease FtsH